MEKTVATISVSAVLLAGVLCTAGCGGHSGRAHASASAIATHTARTRSPKPSARPTSPAAEPTHPHVGFTAGVAHVTPGELRHSWHHGCPVSPANLRRITMTYWGFDHTTHHGALVVNATATGPLVKVFHRLYAMRYPIRRMVPVDHYSGSDFKSIEADNTSAFNCRNATGSSGWSEHAYGLAVDLNPCENPYVYANGHVDHPRCRKFAARGRHDPGLIHPGDATVRAFAAVHWGWGGVWSGARDYQHFSANGR